MAIHRIIVCLFAASTLTFNAFAQEEPDVVVYGATAAGTVAAIAAADQGLDVLLLEPGQHVGGMVSGGLGRTDHANKAVIGGMSREFFERVGEHYDEDITWYFEPHVAEQVYRDWLDEAGVTVKFGERLVSLTEEDGRVTSMTMASGNTYSAPIFIEATYEGDSLKMAGIAYTWGREGRDQYGESLAGKREYSPKHQFDVVVNPYDDDGNLLPLIYDGDYGEAGDADRKVQAYNYRLCMTKNKDNQIPWPKPEGYDPADWELLKRYLQAKPDLTVPEICNPVLLKNGKTDTNNNGPISTDYIGASWEYPEASHERRMEMWEEHKRYTQGFFYFLANDPSVPDKLQAEINEWGLAADEFTDNNNWPHQLYIREARRMIGEYVMTQHDLQTERTKDDSIGMGSYNSDSHNVQRMAVMDGPNFPEGTPAVLNEGDMQVSVRPYEISLGTILPKKTECENLFVVCCVSASHVAYSSIRMEPQYMIMGHAAGVTAALALKYDVAIQDVPVAELQEILRDQDAVLSLEDASAAYVNPKKLPGIVVDNENARIEGDWGRSTSVSPFVGIDYNHEGDSNDGSSTARYIPNLPSAGRYEIRVSYSANPNRATNTPVTINTLDGPKTVTINQRENPGEHKPFVSLGTFALEWGKVAWVEIGTKDTDGYVIADAVQWIPVD